MERNEIMTVSDLLKILPFKERTIRKYVAERKIPYSKVRGRILFRRSEIDEWVSAGTVAVVP